MTTAHLVSHCKLSTFFFGKRFVLNYIIITTMELISAGREMDISLHALKPGRSGPDCDGKMHLHTHPLVLEGQRGTQGTFLPHSGPRVLLPTKTSQAFSQFPDSSPSIVFPVSLMAWGSVCHVVTIFGSVWWCTALCTCWYFVFERAGAGSLRAVTAVGPTVRCPVID